MRLLVLIFLLISASVFGQNNPFDKIPLVSEILDKKDTFEVTYERYVGLHHRVDTLPLFTNDENNGWRNIQLATHYSNNGSVIIISFRDGERGNYYFFFKGPHLKKVRIADQAMVKTKSYYYTVAENNSHDAQIEISFAKGLLGKDKIGLLVAGQSLKAKFHRP